MKVRAVQFSPVLGDSGKNLEFHRRAIAAARRDGVELIVFPELSLSGYQLQDIATDVALRPDGPEIKKLAALSRSIGIIAGAPVEDPPGLIYNCALCFWKGSLRHLHRKVQLPNYGMFEERKIFAAGDRFQAFDLGGLRVGLLVCREILFPMHAYLYFLQHSDLLIGISNSPQRALAEQGFASFQLWETMGAVFAQYFHQHYLFVNRVGFEDGIGFGGGSFFAAAGRGIVKKAAYFEADTLDVDLDRGEVRRARLASNYLRDDQPQLILKEMERILDARD